MSLYSPAQGRAEIEKLVETFAHEEIHIVENGV
jgi:hypothetical protein